MPHRYDLYKYLDAISMARLGLSQLSINLVLCAVDKETTLLRELCLLVR